MARPRHGKYRTPEYQTWKRMLARCYDPRSAQFPDGGGRGITVCDRWLGENGFENFLADMGPRPAGHVLYRRKVAKVHSPDTCTWATRTQSGRDRRRNVLIEYDGRFKIAAAVADELGIPRKVMYRRVRNGCTGADLLRPPRQLSQSARSKLTLLTLNGETRTLSEWGALLGIKYSTLAARLSRGCTAEEALSPCRSGVPKPYRRRADAPVVEFRGESNTVLEWARKLGMPETTLHTRIKRWGVERAMTEPPRPYKKRAPRSRA